MLKRLIIKISQCINKGVWLLEAINVRYTSVPLWRPWRDF